METRLVPVLATHNRSLGNDTPVTRRHTSKANDGGSHTTYTSRVSPTFIHSSVLDAVAGAAAGALAKTAVAPIERVKLLMQLSRTVSTTTTPNTHNSPSSGWDVAKQIYQQQGLKAFWRGNVPNILRQGGTSALNFLFMDQYKQIIHPLTQGLSYSFSKQRDSQDSRKRQRLIASFLSGGLAGGTTTTLLYPFDFLRTRLALDMGNQPESRMYPRGMRDVLVSIWRTDGFRGYYQGYGIALSGVVLYRALHLGGYDVCKTELLEMKKIQCKEDESNNISLSWGERIVVAEVVSLVAGTLCYPIDSVRRRLMMQAGIPQSLRLYHNATDCFRKIWVEEGVRGFYLGLGPNIFRSVSGALLLVSYDMFKEILSHS